MSIQMACQNIHGREHNGAKWRKRCGVNSSSIFLISPAGILLFYFSNAKSFTRFALFSLRSFPTGESSGNYSLQLVYLDNEKPLFRPIFKPEFLFNSKFWIFMQFPRNFHAISFNLFRFRSILFFISFFSTSHQCRCCCCCCYLLTC